MSTSGQTLPYPTFTGSAAALEDAEERGREAAARRHTIRYMRKKLVDLLPDHSALQRVSAAIPTLPARQRSTESGGTWEIQPLLEGGLGQDIELSAGIALRFWQPLGGLGRRFEAFTEITGLAQATDWMTRTATGTGYSLRAGMRMTFSDLSLTVDETLSQGVGQTMEGPSERRASLAYAIRF